MNSIRNKLTLKTTAILLFVFTGSLYGSDGDANSISFFLLATGLLGGMGMFLYGMEMMSDGMKVTAGNSMRTILEKLTS
ncbi:MAG: Na/Pi cotransporter family protein, partial [Candidatus Neomarinimicrobiota bacterium]|nr:Na/Pi cotransporter family protein [Candidatus Neomarinimicrobiota bacterium]